MYEIIVILKALTEIAGVAFLGQGVLWAIAGSKRDQNLVYKLFKTIAKTAVLGETLQHPHVLKHTAAMLMVQQGANAFLIRQHLGHRSFDSTLAYVNPSDADASAASAKAFCQVF